MLFTKFVSNLYTNTSRCTFLVLWRACRLRKESIHTTEDVGVEYLIHDVLSPSSRVHLRTMKDDIQFMLSVNCEEGRVFR